MDSVAFESVWNNIKDKYASEVSPCTLFFSKLIVWKPRPPFENVYLSWQQANTETPAEVETTVEEVREPPSDNDSEQYPEEDIPEEEEEDDDEEDEEEDQEDGDYKVSAPDFSIKLMLHDSSFPFVSHSSVCSISRALLRRRPQIRRKTMTRGRCHPSTRRRRTSLMVRVCRKVSESAVHSCECESRCEIMKHRLGLGDKGTHIIYYNAFVEQYCTADHNLKTRFVTIISNVDIMTELVKTHF